MAAASSLRGAPAAVSVCTLAAVLAAASAQVVTATPALHAAAAVAADGSATGAPECSHVRSLHWDVQVDRPQGGNCTLSLIHQGEGRVHAGVDGAPRVWACADGLFCKASSHGSRDGIGTCQPSAKYGQACDTSGGHDPCEDVSPFQITPMRCVTTDPAGSTGVCRYANSLSDACVVDADCIEGTCSASSKVCVGTLAAGQLCTASRTDADAGLGSDDAACVVGTYCSAATGKCEATKAVGGPCAPDQRDREDSCGLAMCNTATTPKPLCQALASQMPKSPASDSLLCTTMYVDTTTGNCASTRPGGTVATGSACTDDGNCTSALDVCACDGHGSGVCAAIVQDMSDAQRTAGSCLAATPCGSSTDPFEATSCAAAHCSLQVKELLCAQVKFQVQRLHAGTPLTGEAGSQLKTLMNELYGCTDLDGLNAGTVTAIVVGCVVVVGSATFLYLRRRTDGHAAHVQMGEPGGYTPAPA